MAVERDLLAVNGVGRTLCTENLAGIGQPFCPFGACRKSGTYRLAPSALLDRVGCCSFGAYAVDDITSDY